MPIIDENRTVLKYGIERIKKKRRKAFALLIEKLGIEPERVDVHKISFGLGPHFNAAGRIESAETALNFLLTKDDGERRRLAEELVKKNRERQELQSKMFQECEEYLSENYGGEPAIFLRPEHIHEGVAGIVAGKIREKYNRPTFVLSEANGELKASCRSIPTVDIISILQKHSELFLKMGGHKMAAGFSIASENYDKLRELILADIGELKKEDLSIFDLQTKFDLELRFTDINKKMVKELAAFAPFGNGNPRPIFRLGNVRISKFWTVGREGEHVKGRIADLDFISWYNADELLPLLESKSTFAAAYGTLAINEYQGREEVQFTLTLLE
jgi:single-stranded-DNA-specific exonuclease